jgi:hypothetical protein
MRDFAIIQVVGVGSRGPIYIRKTWKGAVNLAVKMAMEQLTEEDDPGEKEVRAEVEEMAQYMDNNGEWSVCIENVHPR